MDSRISWWSPGSRTRRRPDGERQGISDLLEGKEEADAGGSQERAAAHAAGFAFEVLAKM